jgi:uncharacterized protein
VVSITSLFIYPIKGCRGLTVTQWPLESKGLRHDRQWMFVNAQGRFVSQRECAQLAHLHVAASETGWSLTYSNEPTGIVLPYTLAHSVTESALIWEDEVQVMHYSHEADAYLSARIGQALRLMYLPDESPRLVDPNYCPDVYHTRLSDGFPVLILGTASLEMLNQKLSHPLGWDRFRPNIVVKSTIAHEEDGWQRLGHTHYSFQLVKPCARCVVTTIDQELGTRSAEPLQTLSTYRKFGNKILFGMNALPDLLADTAMLQIGDVLEPLVNAQF